MNNVYRIFIDNKMLALAMKMLGIACVEIFYEAYSHLIFKYNVEFNWVLGFVFLDFCLDAKLLFDDNAEFRQKDVFDLRDRTQEDKSEVAAAAHNLVSWNNRLKNPQYH